MNVLEVLSVAFGLIAGAGGAVGYFKKGMGDSIIAYQSNEISLRNDTIARQITEIAALTVERDALKRQATDLASLAQGSPQLVKLTEQIKALTEQVAAVVQQGAKT